MAQSVYDDLETPTPQAEGKKHRRSRSKHRESISPSEFREGQLKLHDMVEASLETLYDAMLHADFNNAIKAAQIVLDRTGFGPKSTVDVNANIMDLSELSREELAERASYIAEALRKSAKPGGPVVVPMGNSVN